MDFTEAVKTAMASIGMKKPALAKETGYSYQHIHDLLSGDRRWNEDSIDRVCGALGIQVTFEQKEEEQTNAESSIQL